MVKLKKTTKFSGTSGAQWIQKTEKDLKGKPLDDLLWTEVPNLAIKPAYHPDDKVVAGPFFSNGKNHWSICEVIRVKTPKKGNEIALSVLKNGANALHFIFDKNFQTKSLEKLIKGIHLRYVRIYFSFGKTVNADKMVDNCLEILNPKKKQPETQEGGFFLAPTKKNSVFDERLNPFPSFGQVLVEDGTYKGKPEKCIDSMVGLLKKATSAMNRVERPEENVERIQFKLSIGTNYLFEIARIRALKLLWAHVCEAYDIPFKIGQIHAEILPSKGKDQHRNMIQFATQTMSGVLGGVDNIIVPPADVFKNKENDFTRRISRNVSHLLAMESYLDRVEDPAAGSYYIEKLTNEIAKEVWRKFTTLS